MSFSHTSIMKIDLKEVSLQQIYNQLESEHFFTSDSKLFLQKSYATNSFTIGIRRNKMVAAQWHEVNQTKAKGELIIKSRYKNWFFPGYAMAGLPALILLLDWSESESSILVIFILMILGTILLTLFFAWADLREQAKAIERELIIRYNFLLRKKPG